MGDRRSRRRTDAAACGVPGRARDRWSLRRDAVDRAAGPGCKDAPPVGWPRSSWRSDLDGDGVREVITVSVIAEGDAPGIYVDAASGKDGRRLWWWKSDLPKELTQIRKPAWWGRGPDGWPLLALPLGGEVVGDMFALLDDGRSVVPVVHLLEASTGRERHTVLGLTSARFADLDGDGLTDLWGDVEGELRAFRGEAPEAWRALGRFDRAGSPRGEAPEVWRSLRRFGVADPREATMGLVGNRIVDFDGDGVADTLIGGLEAPGPLKHVTTGSRTAMARSGRDGRLIWKTEIDPRTSWFQPNSGDTYALSAFPLPAGDLDGDGTADVIVQKHEVGAGVSSKRQAATLPLDLLSGRTGARVWSGGRLPSSSA